MEQLPERKPKNLRPFDYHHEKVALTQMAHWLAGQGWEARLSVPPAKVADLSEAGIAPPDLDDAFVAQFDGEDWRFRYRFYRDNPGNFDLVARRDGRTLIVDGKGQSATNKRGAVAQMVGSLTLARDPSQSDRDYAILVPEGPAWDKALGNYGQLEWLGLYRIEAAPPGKIRQDAWDRHRQPGGTDPSL